MEIDLQLAFDYGRHTAAEPFEEDVRRSVLAALVAEGFDRDAAVELNYVPAEEIREINRDLRGVDRVTDVLSIPFLELEEDGTLRIEESDVFEAHVLLGEIIICYERAVQQAEEYGHSLLRELCFLAVHSTLHLLGYDHERGAAQEKEMFEKQESILQSLGIER